MKKFKIFNDFGITPSKNYEAAGYDFYIPYIKGIDENKLDKIFSAFAKSYKIETTDITNIYNRLSFFIESCYGKEYSAIDVVINALHLFLAIENDDLPNVKSRLDNIDGYIDIFIDNYLIFNNMIPGIELSKLTYMLFNSGIKLKLNENTAGIFFNKSGKGNQGLDVRACVVDEDYSGYVHTSLAFDKYWNNIEIYCGDKISQMIIIELEKNEIELVSELEYIELHNKSKRGDSGFGSSDIKH